MTVPGGDSGEKSQDEADQPEQTSAQPAQHTPGESPYPPPSGFAEPSGRPPAGYPPPAYPPSAYPPPSGYPPPGYPPLSGYPPPAYPPPSGYPPPEYQTTPGYGGSAYPPAPPAYGGSAGGYGRPPVGGYPIPDYPAGYGQQSGTNRLAIASLISSCLGLLCCGISSIVGIMLGAVALSQIRQTREEGYGLAVAGIVIGVLIMLIFLLAAILELHSR